MSIKLTVANCSACKQSHDMVFGINDQIPEHNGMIELVSECSNTHRLVYNWMTRVNYELKKMEAMYGNQHSNPNL